MIPQTPWLFRAAAIALGLALAPAAVLPSPAWAEEASDSIAPSAVGSSPDSAMPDGRNGADGASDVAAESSAAEAAPGTGTGHSDGPDASPTANAPQESVANQGIQTSEDADQAGSSSGATASEPGKSDAAAGVASRAAAATASPAAGHENQGKHIFGFQVGSLGEFTLRPRLDLRMREEYRENMDMDIHRTDDRERLLLKVGLGAELAWRNVTLVADISDGREIFHDTESATSELDLTQLYLSIDKPGGIPLKIQLGRQTWKLGSRRLVNSSSWGNRRRNWDGLLLASDLGRAKITAFAGSVTDNLTEQIDYGTFDETLWGAMIDAQVSPEVGLEVYAIGLYTKGCRGITNEKGDLGDENRVTPGFRVWGHHAKERIDWEIEGALQVGRRAGDEIHAFAIHGDIDWELPLPYAPALGLTVNYASGDHDGLDGMDQTFRPLYGSTHSAYGIADFFRWQNMVELSPSISWKLLDRLSLKMEQHTFWLADTHDVWVNSSGRTLRDGTGKESPYVGQEWSVAAVWQPSRGFRLEGGFAVFIGGTYMRDTGDRRGASFGYISTSYKY